MKFFITGGAGFIGSHMTDKLIEQGDEVVVYDNMSFGKEALVKQHFDNKNFKLIKADLLDAKRLGNEVKSSDVLVHLAANSDIIKSASHPEMEIKNSMIATYNVLEAMRENRIKKIIFSSSNVVYGEASYFPTPENYGPCLPISFYGAGKLAAEGLISAYCHNFGIQAWIYRFVNIIGRRGTHGVVLDFYKKLLKDKTKLEVLGNGKQAKPYLEVTDCVNGMLYGFEKSSDGLNLFHLGTKGATSVSKIAQFVLEELDLKKTKIVYSGGPRGWPGDVPTVSVDISKMEKLGWKPKYKYSDHAARAGVKALIEELKKTIKFY